MQRIKSSCSSLKIKSRSTKSNSKSTQVHSRLTQEERRTVVPKAGSPRSSCGCSFFAVVSVSFLQEELAGCSKVLGSTAKALENEGDIDKVIKQLKKGLG